MLCQVVDSVPLTYGYAGIALPAGDARSKPGSEAEQELLASGGGVAERVSMKSACPVLIVLDRAAGLKSEPGN